MTTQEKKLIVRIIDVLNVLRKADNCDFREAFQRLKDVKSINYDLWMALAYLLNGDKGSFGDHMYQAEELANYLRDAE